MESTTPIPAEPEASINDPSMDQVTPVLTEATPMAQVTPAMPQSTPILSTQSILTVTQVDPVVTQVDSAVAQGDPAVAQGDPAVAQASPVVARTHNRVRRRRVPFSTPTIPEPEPCRVHVSGFPPYTQPQELRHAFEAIGPAIVEWLTERSACLLFTCREHADTALTQNNKMIIYGQFLLIRPYSVRPKALSPKRRYKREFIRSKEKDVIVSPSSLELSGDFCTQLDALLAAVRLTRDEAMALGALYADLEDALTPHMPGCIAMPFGSITTGLGIKTSDADCFVMTPAANGANGSHASLMVNRAKRILQMHPQKFAEILPIPRANTPIVKFFHIPTGTNCDLSFKTPLGAQNSRLIAFLLQVDPRFIPVAVAIKYWAKVHDLSGTGKMTNYALTMLIIFYLQQIGMLPAICALQQQRKYDCIVDSWNTGFDNTPLPPSTNPVSISELIGDFYTYYSKFNFNDLVVCPYLGTPIKKDLFKDLTLLPSEFDVYKQNVLSELVPPLRITTTICVQDPFEQSHNVASSIGQRKAEDIKAFFKFAAEAYEKERQNECQNFLKTILLQKPKCVKAKLYPEYRVNLTSRILSTIVSPDWTGVVREIVFVIFERLLKIKLTKFNAEKDTKNTNNVPKKEKEKYTATVTRAIWKRKQLTKLYSLMKLDFKKQQERITEELLTTEKNVFKLPFTLTLHYTSNRAVIVCIKLQDGDPEIFKEFGKFFITIMQRWFISLLQPYTRHPEREMAIKTSESGENANRVPNDITIDKKSLVSDESPRSETGSTNEEGCNTNHEVPTEQSEVSENSVATNNDATKNFVADKDTSMEKNVAMIDNVVAEKDGATKKAVIININKLVVSENNTTVSIEKDLVINENAVLENNAFAEKYVDTEKCLAMNENVVMETDAVADKYVATNKAEVINKNEAEVLENNVVLSMEKDLVIHEKTVMENDAVAEKYVAKKKDLVMNENAVMEMDAEKDVYVATEKD